jgi:hypothetical protein
VRQEPEATAETVAGASYQGIPASPPPEVLEGLDAAAKVLAELAEKRLELRIAAAEGSMDIQIDVRDAHGEVIRRIPTSRTAELLSSGNVRGLLSHEIA